MQELSCIWPVPQHSTLSLPRPQGPDPGRACMLSRRSPVTRLGALVSAVSGLCLRRRRVGFGARTSPRSGASTNPSPERNMAQRDLFRSPPRPWNSARIIGPKPPFKPKHVWAIRQQLKTAGGIRDLALFDCGIDAKLRGCDLVKLRVSDVAPGGSLRQRGTVIQRKTGRPVPSRSRTRRETRSPLGSRFAVGARTTGCSPAGAVRVSTSARASMLAWWIAGWP